jgi:hypothetical protein
LIERFLEKYLGGHIRIGNVVIFGFNAMHVAVEVWSRRLHAYICFHPSVYFYGRWWPWKFYISENATPWAATYAIGPGISREDKLKARNRRLMRKMMAD